MTCMNAPLDEAHAVSMDMLDWIDRKFAPLHEKVAAWEPRPLPRVEDV